MERKHLHNREIFIYTLANPFTGYIYYVGQTVNMEERRKGHWNCERVNPETGEIETKNPIIEELDRCSYHDRFEQEKFWITQVMSWGFTLANRYTPLKKLSYEGIAAVTKMNRYGLKYESKQNIKSRIK